MTERIAAEKMAKRCQASLVNPAGVGVSQMPSARANVDALLDQRAATDIRGGHLTGPSADGADAGGGAHTRPPLEARGSPAHGAVLGRQHVLPLEFVLARGPGVAPGPAEERAGDAVAGSDPLALQLAEHLVATLVGPDRAADHSALAVREPDELGPEADSQRVLPVSSSDPFMWTIDARWSDPRSRVVRVPEAVQLPSNVRHSPAAGAFAVPRPPVRRTPRRASTGRAPASRSDRAWWTAIHLNRSRRAAVTLPMAHYGRLKRTAN